MTETSKEALAKFLDNPAVKSWHSGVATGLKDSTREQYAVFLMRYFGTENPETFLKRAQEKPREVAVEIKGRLGEIYKHSMHAAHITKYALRSFIDFHEVGLEIKAKVKVRRIRKKPELSWDDADRIILETDEPYRTLFKFMKWSGLGEDEVMEIQESANIQLSIDKQRQNTNPYIKIDLSPRKSTLDEFFTLAQKQYMPEFPLNTKTYKNRGSKLIDPHDMQNVWRRAAKKAKLWQEGLGPHQLRSTFKSQCGKLGVARAVSEFCMGHGGGDRYGYSRETTDEKYVASELRKLWIGETAMPEEAAKMALVTMMKATPAWNRLPPEKQAEVEKIFHRTVSMDELQKILPRFLRLTPEENKRATHSRPKKHRVVRGKTALNGGTPVREAYETRVVGEAELVPLLNEGWDIVRELTGGRIILRRPTGLDE